MINNQNRNKVFLVIIAILLITNIAMLGFLLQKKGPDKQGDRPDKKTFILKLLENEVGFSKEQLVAYDTLSSQHRRKISGLYDNMRANKTVQFKNLVVKNFSDSAINEMAGQSAASQKVIETSMFNHIKNIRMLCTPEQTPRFDSAFVKVFNWRDELRKKNEK